MMRSWTLALSAVAIFVAVPAYAVTITNADAESRRIFVCDEKCGPSFGDEWGSASDFWLEPGQSRSFECEGSCFVGTERDGKLPTLGDMAFSDEDENFRGDENGYIRGGYATHK